MHFLLVQPKYYTRYPPLGLLKLAALKQDQGHTVEFIKGKSKPKIIPDEIFVTSLFTYAWKVVHDTVKYYKRLFPDVKLSLGGIYATLMKEHAETSGADEVFPGLWKEAEDYLPDYSLVPDWDGSIVFSSRGCIRKCGFCAVPLLEPDFTPRPSIRKFIYQNHTRVIFWDNNFLASQYKEDIFKELMELNRDVDFNHGLDARLITPDNAESLKALRIRYVHLAYDSQNYHDQIENAINNLKKAGFRGRDLMFYTLYNFKDTPDDFLERVRDLLRWGVVSYPMRYTPLNAKKKNEYISPNWTDKQLEMVADARRVIGIRGSFPPYRGLQDKIINAKSFQQAFKLRPVNVDRVRKCNKPLSREVCELSDDDLKKCVDYVFTTLNGKNLLNKTSIVPKVVKVNNLLLHSESSRLRLLDFIEEYIKAKNYVTSTKSIYINRIYRRLTDIPQEVLEGFFTQIRESAKTQYYIKKATIIKKLRVDYDVRINSETEKDDIINSLECYAKSHHLKSNDSIIFI